MFKKLLSSLLLFLLVIGIFMPIIFPPPVHALTEYLRPNAAGDLCTITFETGSACPNHYLNVDEAVADDDTTFVYTTNVASWYTDLYGLSNTSGSGTINWVKVWFRGFGYLGSFYGRTAIKTGGTVYYGSSEDLPDGTWGNYSTQYVQNPQTLVDWTWADLDALQAGVSLLGDTVAAGATACTQVWVEIDYTETVGVVTSATDNVEETTATLNGEITSDAGETIDYYGFVWDTVADAGDPGDVDPSGPPAGWEFGWKSGVGDYGENVFDHNITGLPEGTTIKSRACAHGDVTGWVYGDGVTFLTKPDEPTGFTVVPSGVGQLTLDWAKGDGAQKTYIRGKVGAYPTGVGDPTTYDGVVIYNDTGVSYDHSGLTPSDTWYYRAWSYVTEGVLEQWSDTYAEDNAMVLDLPVVTVQAASSVEETTAVLNGNITDVGIANCDHRGFVWGTSTHVQPNYTTAPAGSGYSNFNDEAGAFASGAYTYAGGTFAKGTLYYVRSWAHNIDGYSYSSTEVTFLTKPDSPTGLSVSTISSTQLTLAWTGGAGATRYMVRYKLGAIPPVSTVDGTQVYLGVLTGYGHTGLDVGTQYSYSVWSEVTLGGWTKYSDTYISGTGTTTDTATYLTNFQYYIPITVTSSCAVAQELRIPFIINSAGLADGGYVQPDFDDVVLVRVDTLLPLTVTDIAAETLHKDGEATSDSDNVTLIDTTLTQADAYWNGCTIEIIETTDGLAPEGDTELVTVFDHATSTLTFAALTGTTSDGDLYTLDNFRSKYFTNIELAAYQQVVLKLYLGYPAEGVAEREFCTAEADTITVADNADFDITDNITVMATVRVFDLPGAAKKIVSKDGAYELGIDVSDKPYFKVWHAADNVTATFSSALSEDEVYMLMGTYSDTDNLTKIYVNGSDNSTADANGAIITTLTDVVLMDIDNCEVDDIKIGHTDLVAPTYVLDLAMEADDIGATSILDQSAGVHNASVVWDISLPSCITVEVGAATEVDTWASPGGTEAAVIEVFELPTEPVGWMPVRVNFTDLPAYPLVNSAGLQLGWTDATMYRILVFFTAIGVGTAIGVATASALLSGVAVGVMLSAGVGAGIIGWWVVLLYGLFVMGYIVASRSM